MSKPDLTIAELTRRLGDGHETGHSVALACGDCTLRVDSNSGELIEHLALYFAPFLTDAGTADILIRALEMPAPDLHLDFVDWPREGGKVGRKDSYIDLADGRVCRKVRTGMQYLLGAAQRVVFGECLKNDNQVINLVVSQYIGWLMDRNWALCHASGVAHQGMGLAIAAFSGGGKSTLALHLLNQGLNFISNDRSLIALDQGLPVISGVPKHPRINPGTVLNNPSLTDVIPAGRRRQLARLPAAEIWDLEEKYDALIDRIYGPDRFRLSAGLHGLMILNWQRDSDTDTRFTPIDIRQRPDLLSAVMKPPGPFYIPRGADRPSGFVDVEPQDYYPVLDRIPVIEVTGRVDFDRARDYSLSFLS